VGVCDLTLLFSVGTGRFECWAAGPFLPKPHGTRLQFVANWSEFSSLVV
jgi:hypothetical protein